MSTDLARTRLPVLAPGLPEVVARGRLVSQGDSYVFITSDDGAKITVHGTSIAAEVASPSAELERMVEAAAETAVRVELTEEGIDASLRRFGASYLVRITCADPADRRCSEEGYARELARSLAVIGGSPQP